MKKKIKILAQENNQIRLFGEMTLSEKKPPLIGLTDFTEISDLPKSDGGGRSPPVPTALL